MKKTNRALTSSLLALSLGLASGASMALPWIDGINLMEDDFYEALINNDGSTDPNTGLPTLTVGDTLRGIFDITSFNADTLFDPELVGIFEAEVLTATPTAKAGIFDYTFGARTAGSAWADGSISDGKTIIWMYNVNGNDNFPFRDGGPGGDACDTLAECEALVTDGSLWATFGIPSNAADPDYDADNEWFANGVPDTPGIFRGVSESTQIGNFAFTMSLLVNNTGRTIVQHDLGVIDCLILYTCAGDRFVDLSATGSPAGTRELYNGTYGDGTFGEYDVSGDVQLKIAATVPEPGTLTLLGLGALGIGVAGRRRRKTA